jgi:CRP-like cAMP-binding protein
MPDFQFTEKLLNTPLFQGISKSDLHTIVGYTKFGFGKHRPGEVIVKANEPCTGLIFLLNGTVEATTKASDNSYEVTEHLGAPMQIQPERLFGLHQTYTSTFRAQTVCNTLSLMKSEVTRLCNNYEVFRINIINLLSSGMQKAEERSWLAGRIPLRMRIIRFFTLHCLRPAGEKTVKIRMNDLAGEVNDSRLNISRELNKLQSENLIRLSRGTIHIPALERLYM